MWLRRMRRIWQLRVLLAGCAMAALIAVGGRTLAQMRNVSEQFDRDERRVERKVDALEKDFYALQLNNDRRLVKIETQIDNFSWLMYTVVGILLLGVGDRLLGLILKRRPADKGEGA